MVFCSKNLLQFKKVYCDFLGGNLEHYEVGNEKKINKILTYSISFVVICTALFMVNPIIAFADDRPIIGDDYVMEISLI